MQRQKTAKTSKNYKIKLFKKIEKIILENEFFPLSFGISVQSVEHVLTPIFFRHDFRFVEKQSGWITRYPFVELFIGLGLLLMFLIDELVKRAFKDEDEFYIESQATSLVRRMSTDPHFQKHG